MLVKSRQIWFVAALALINACPPEDQSLAEDKLPKPTFVDTADAGLFEKVRGFGICAEWSTLGPPPVVPIGTTIPTLVLAGQFDPVAGVALSRQIADEIGAHALWAEFPRLGHNVRFFSPDAAGIVSRFIEHPEATLHASCCLARPPIPFLLKSEQH